MRPPLDRALPWLRLPDGGDEPPEPVPDGAALRCPRSGRTFPLGEGFLDLLGEHEPKRTFSQRALDTPFTAWAYDRGRDALMRAWGLGSFADEVGRIQERLGVRPGEAVLDLACGHGNFTVEWAKRVGPDGFVIGLDLSASMLRRAAARVEREKLDNELLVRADAHRLPLAGASFPRVNCSGGFHGFPDLSRAIRELGRIAAPGATLTASFFAEDPDRPHPRLREWLRERYGLHFVPLPWLTNELEASGFRDVVWSVPRLGFGYASGWRGGEEGSGRTRGIDEAS